MKTDTLIERLARDVEPVIPLQRPWRRAATWLVGAAIYLAVLALTVTSSADVAANGSEWRFLLPQVETILIAVAAAVAAFASVVPGASPRVLLWPVAAVALWIGSLLAWSFKEWQTIGTAGLASEHEWLCVAMIAVGGALPALAMARMLRHGAPLTPRTTGALVMLAAAGMMNVGACVSSPHTSSAVVLVWHGATIAALVAVSAWASRLVFSWERVRHLVR